MNKLDFRSQDFSQTGKAMYELACELFPIPRSITGQCFRDSLEILNKTLGGGILKFHSIKSGTKVFDWIVPDEWNAKEAYIITPEGEKICDFKKHNLHLLNYSEAIDKEIGLEERRHHIPQEKDGATTDHQMGEVHGGHHRQIQRLLHNTIPAADNHQPMRRRADAVPQCYQPY